MISVVEYAGSEILDVFIRGGAGGPYRQVGDFVWSNQRLPYTQSGQWGYLRVLPADDSRISPWVRRDRVRGKQKHNRSRKGSPQRCNRSGGFWWGLRARVHSPQAPAGPCRFLSGRVQA